MRNETSTFATLYTRSLYSGKIHIIILRVRLTVKIPFKNIPHFSPVIRWGLILSEISNIFLYFVFFSKSPSAYFILEYKLKYVPPARRHSPKA